MTLLVPARKKVTRATGVFCCSSKSFYYRVTLKKLRSFILIQFK